jgi:cupin fold WbuC family metalloprotein
MIKRTPTDEMIRHGFSNAHSSLRKRYPLLLHEHGAYFNEVFNFICRDSYMQPHLHPGSEKNEIIQVVRGTLAVLYFDENGIVTEKTLLNAEQFDSIEVPAFTWHTYVMLSSEVITYECMNGIYNPVTWKQFAPWAPSENSAEATAYFETLALKVQ